MNVNRLLFKTIEKPTGRVETENWKTEEESKKSTEEVSREKAKEEEKKKAEEQSKKRAEEESMRKAEAESMKKAVEASKKKDKALKKCGHQPTAKKRLTYTEDVQQSPSPSPIDDEDDSSDKQKDMFKDTSGDPFVYSFFNSCSHILF